MRNSGCAGAARFFIARNQMEKGGTNGTDQSIPGDRAHRQTDAAICGPLHHFAAGRRAVQHRRSDLYRKRQLSRFIRQRGQHGRVPVDGGCAGDRRDDRGRLLRFCQLEPRAGRPGCCQNQRRQCRYDEHHQQPDPDLDLSGVPAADHRPVRRHGQRGDLCLLRGILFLYQFGYPVLYVRTGHEPDHPCGREPEIRNGVHARRRGRQHHT